MAFPELCPGCDAEHHCATWKLGSCFICFSSDLLPKHPLCIVQREMPPSVIWMFWWGNPLLEVCVFCHDLLSSAEIKARRSHHDHQVWYLCSLFYPEVSALEHFHTGSISSAASRPTFPPAWLSVITSTNILHKLRNLSQNPCASWSNNNKSNRVNAIVNNWKVT